MTLDVNMLVNRPIKRSKQFYVHATLPTLNEYTLAARGNKFASSAMKKKAENFISIEASTQLGTWQAENPVFVVFHWVEKDKRRDHDNVAFAKKFILDALVKTGVLKGDGWKHVIGFIDLFSIDSKMAGVEVTILEVSDE